MNTKNNVNLSGVKNDSAESAGGYGFLSESFLDLYRELEEALAVKYGSRSGLIQIFANGEGWRWREELNLFRETRNLLSHHARLDGEPPVSPSPAAVNKLREIVTYVQNPPRALSVCTRTSGLFVTDGGDSVTDLLAVMDKRGYSHIPVLKNGRLQGVFSVGTLFAYAKSYPDRGVKGLLVSDMSAFLPPEKHTTEQFCFASAEDTSYDIRCKFSQGGPFCRRVAAVFVTEGGTEEGKLLGMITPWDIIRSGE